jgi:hypothetical protein
MKLGQVLGATDRYAGIVASRPIHYQYFFAMFYRNIGIDLTATTLPDPNRRPQHLLDRGEPIRELI